MEKYDVIVIGGGPAGVTAAIYAKRYNLNVLLISLDIGGLMNEAYKVDNWTGFFNITGREISEKLTEHLKYLDVPVAYEQVKLVSKDGDNFKIEAGSNEYLTDVVVYSLGTVHRKLNVESAKKYDGLGVSYCATCDAAFFKNKTVAVVGGGDSAGRAAQILSEHSSKIYMLIRKTEKELRIEPALKDEIFATGKLELVEQVNVSEVYGKDVVEGVKLDNGTDLKVDGLFIEIGLIPKTELITSIGLKLDEAKYIIVDEKMQTNVKGFYAAGDVTDKNSVLRQAVTASAQGAIAALSAFEYIKEKKRG